MVLLIIIPIKWLFHWEYTLFSDKPMWRLDDVGWENMWNDGFTMVKHWCFWGDFGDLKYGSDGSDGYLVLILKHLEMLQLRHTPTVWWMKLQRCWKLPWSRVLPQRWKKPMDWSFSTNRFELIQHIEGWWKNLERWDTADIMLFHLDRSG